MAMYMRTAIYLCLPDEQTSASTTKQNETDDEWDLQFLWLDEDEWNKDKHPDDEANEVLGLQV